MWKKDLFNRIIHADFGASHTENSILYGNRLFLLIYSVVMSFAIATASNLNGYATDMFLSFLLVFADSFLLCCLAWLLSKIRMGWLVLAAVVVLTISELFVVFFYHSLISLHVVQLVVETTGQESREFLSTALASNALKPTCITTAVVMAISALLTWTFSRYWHKKWLRYTLFALIAWSCLRQASAYVRLARCFTCESIPECVKIYEQAHLNTPYIRLLNGLAFNRASSIELNTLAETVEQTQVDSCSAESPLIILLIGESYNKHHSQLYNPDYLTTCPKLQAWKDKGNLVVYEDAVTPYNLTSEAFRSMFSTWDDECGGYWTEHTLFPAVFRKAGYAVHFVTNQFVLQSNSDFNMMGGTIFNHPHLSELQFTSRNSNAYPFDGELIQEIPDHSVITSSPTLLIVHFYGQHVGYYERFPKNFAHFTPADEKTVHGGEAGRICAADYDNATLYNDAVVDSILQMYAQDDAICIYLSDHGEEVYDWRECYERTSEAVIPREAAHYQYEIPLLFFMTDTFQQKHTEIADRVRRFSQRRFLSTDISNVLFHLAGIKSPEYKADKDILSDHYNEQRKRIIKNDTDYDALMAE